MAHHGFDGHGSFQSGVSTPRNTVKLACHTSLLATLLLLGSTSLVLPAWSNSLLETQLAQTPVNARILYVNPVTGTDSAGAGTSEATPVRTITYALQQATANTIVQLAPGSYTTDTGEVFPLIVNKGVTLRGDEQGKGQRVAIIGGGTYLSRTQAGQNITILAGENTVISGLTLTNPNLRGTGVWVESTNPVIRNNTFIRNRREGIFVTGTAAPKIESNVFTQNEGQGISAARASTGEIRDNLFQDTGAGIAITETAAPLIEQNRIFSNQDGIVISDAATPRLRGNMIENNSRYGVVVTRDAQPNLGTADNPGGNRIRNNARFDLNNTTRSNTIVAVGNDIDQAKISGLVDFVATTIGGSTNLRDIQGHWAQAYIEALAAQNIIAGFPDGTFRPNEPVTRAQFAAIISQAFTPQAKRASTDFTDVARSFWGYQVIQSAYRGEFVSGYPDRTFKPNQRIPRVQALVSLASGLNLRSPNTSVLSVYSDAAQIPNYALTAVAGATQNQLVVNYPTPSQLNPNQDATRADVAAFVYQALVNAGRAEALPSPYLVRNSL